MSEVTRYTMDYKGLPQIDTEGAYVLHEDYAALQQKLDALAAENASLKQWALQADELWSSSCDLDGHFDDLPETPATESYLNSVRAEGVDYVADAIGEKCSMLKVGSKEWKALKNIVFTLVEFAERIRSTK